MHMACRNAAKDTQEGLAGKCWVAFQGPDFWVYIPSFTAVTQHCNHLASLREAFQIGFQVTLKLLACAHKAHCALLLVLNDDVTHWNHMGKLRTAVQLNLWQESASMFPACQLRDSGGGPGMRGKGLTHCSSSSHPISSCHSTVNSSSMLCLLPLLTSLLLHSQRSQRGCYPLFEHFILLPVPPPEQSNVANSTTMLTPPSMEVPGCLNYCESLKVTQIVHVRADLIFPEKQSSSIAATLTKPLTTPLGHCKSVHKSSNPLHIHACFQCGLVTSVLCINPSVVTHSLYMASEALCLTDTLNPQLDSPYPASHTVVIY